MSARASPQPGLKMHFLTLMPSCTHHCENQIKVHIVYTMVHGNECNLDISNLHFRYKSTTMDSSTQYAEIFFYRVMKANFRLILNCKQQYVTVQNMRPPFPFHNLSILAVAKMFT